MDCKKALTETDGDMEAAVDWLRKKGLAAAAKKAGRVASEGLVAVAVDGTAAAVVEVNAETDFVARNDQFQDMVEAIAGVALANGGDLDKTKAAGYRAATKMSKNSFRKWLEPLVKTCICAVALACPSPMVSFPPIFTTR